MRRLNPARILKRLRAVLAPPHGFLKRVKSVIHVGANDGQERALYDRYGLAVTWIEPIPEVFERLQRNIRDYPRQSALQALITDKDDVEYAFHVADNDGHSSSILEMGRHPEFWPDVHYARTIPLRSITLMTLAAQGKIRIEGPTALVLDTQGTELRVLSGAESLLPKFRYLQLEAADFEVYRGCCRVEELGAYLAGHGFRERRRTAFAGRAGTGFCYDIVYERRRR